MGKVRSLYDTLQSRIFSYGAILGAECQIIVMHPNTWRDMWEQAETSGDWQFMVVNPPHMGLAFMGIKVVRSYDVAEGIFEIF